MGEQVYKIVIGKEEKEYASGTRYLDIAEEYQEQYRDDIVMAVHNNKLRD